LIDSSLNAASMGSSPGKNSSALTTLDPKATTNAKKSVLLFITVGLQTTLRA
jgi:hypothetical protein